MTGDEYVYWEDDPTTKRKVKRGCLLCYPMQDLDEVLLVSPSGIAHRPSEYGMTECGKDATQGDWWWRS